MSGSIISLLNEKQKQQLFSTRKEIFCAAGHSLFSRGDRAEHMYLIEKGKVSLYRLMPSGDEKLFKVFLAGGAIAEMAMFMSPLEYPMSARVEQDSVLWEFSHDDVVSLVSQSPDLSLKVMEHMSNSVHKLMNTLNILTQLNANQRLVMKLAEIYREQLPQENKLCLPVTKRLLASQLGMKPETLSRVIKKLKTEGHIAESGHHLALIDIPSLCKSVDLTPDIFAAS
ncbi:Crp/Fnr family transcriptional regulator [Vibrio sp. JC009]|uniref:Crp/Fnr family transcriptional regulator n=1 Tax=Vibrio sp. JC009 TaxID=2912314 RepID=UPI0023AFFA91|nr:Crp/Fnr family transcriptional regulator [Vibrio sp. JC009]WED23847.1 Crp/Fnr family transcriptional regulator [Vibrio sp. JC009]